MLRARGRTRSLEGASTISTKEKNIMLSNRRRFLQGAASAKVAPVTLQDRSYEPLKFPRPISLAALTILDVSPANQVLCAAKAGYLHPRPPQGGPPATSASASCPPPRPKRSTT